MFPSSKIGLKNFPAINGHPVNLDLLYQIVTSNGGWEKVNSRNEWDDLLEHFQLPKGINGGLLIKQIYLKYLETYEKIYFLGEDVDGGKHHPHHHHNDFDDEIDDFRSRRRHSQKFTPTGRSQPQSSSTPQAALNPLPIPIPDHLREQLGLAPRLQSTDYDRLCLSLQSPLPNEQDMAITVCNLLSNETKHVLKFSNCPAILNLLLAHAGVYQHCGLRVLMEETYVQGRNLDVGEFWQEVVQQEDVKHLLCESYVSKVQSSLGLNDEETEDISMIDISELVSSQTSSLSQDGKCKEDGTNDSIVAIDDPVLIKIDDPVLINIYDTPSKTKEGSSSLQNSPAKKSQQSSIASGKGHKESLSCCAFCPCQQRSSEFETHLLFSNKPGCSSQEADEGQVSLPFCLGRSAGSDDKVGLRVNQITHILRNLSFEEENGGPMASNPTLLRYLLITANCSWGNLPQMSYDILGNLSSHIQLQDPMKDPLSSMLLTLVTSGLFSPDRFKIIRSLEILRDLTKIERNERVIVRYLETKVYQRMCELLTICDIMLLIYTLECILAMTGLGEAVCNELVRVKGAVAALVSLVTVEAQSYGPKGCILMRVVETVTGNSTTSSTTTTSTVPSTSSNCASGATATPPSSSTPSTSPAPLSSMSTPTGPNSMLSIGLRTVAGQTVTVPSPLQQQQQPTTASPLGPQVTLVSKVTLNTGPTLPSSPATPFYQLNTLRGSNTSSPTGFSKLPNSRPESPPPQLGPPHLTLNQMSRAASNLSTQLQRPRSVSPKPTGLSVTTNHLNVGPVPQLQRSTPAFSVGKATTRPAVPFSKKELVLTSVGGGGATGAGGLAQVSNQSLTQQVYTPSSSSVSSCSKGGAASEEGWAVAWLKGAFEVYSGTSIEKEEAYRMYCGARNSPSVVLSEDLFIQCFKTVYGASVGPVMKTFGSTQLSFLEGIRPKLSMRPVPSVTTPSPVNNGIVVINSPAVGTGSAPLQTHPDGEVVPAATVSNGISGRPTTPVHTPSPLSPILKATLSRPPTPKSPPGGKKGKKLRQESKDAGKEGRVKKKLSQPSKSNFKDAKILSPSSSAIRSLLASKVAQRQQSKLQQQSTPKKGGRRGKISQIKMNGLDSIEKGEESSASSSMNSTEEFEVNKGSESLTFRGFLQCNGTSNSEDSVKGSEAVEEVTIEGFDELGKNSRIKGMLVDLLERKVLPRGDVTLLNGMIGREIRISDKGLELVEKSEGGSPMGEATSTTELQEQKMTFYASTSEVTPTVPVQSPLADPPSVLASSGSDLLSGGEEGSGHDQVKNKREGERLSASGDPDEGGGYKTNAGGGSGGEGFGFSETHSPSTSSSGDGNANGSEGSSNISGGGDLLDQFDLFSDLIVVNPEQLGLGKRSQRKPSVTGEDQGPPTKKPALCMNGGTGPEPHLNNTASVLQAALSLPPSTQQGQVAGGSTPAHPPTNEGSSVQAAASGNNGTSHHGHVMHLPVRLSVANTAQNPPQQLTFARQLVMPSGQQFILATGGSQPGIQGQQMILAAKPGTSSDQLPKAILILQPTQQSSGSSAPGQSTHSSVVGGGSGFVQGQVITVRKEGVPPSGYGHIPMDQLEAELPFMCEWAGCGYRFIKYQQVFMHAVSTHIPNNTDDAVRCEWGPLGCDPLVRKKYSLMTHLQDRHCSKQALDLAIYRRKNKIEPPPPPQPNPHHPGYAPNAAYHAIKRHALQFMNPKELMDENEGPVTKSIRLTASLILRNLVNYSSLGRRMIGGYESHIASVAMSNVESSRTLAQLLHDMSETAVGGGGGGDLEQSLPPSAPPTPSKSE